MGCVCETGENHRKVAFCICPVYDTIYSLQLSRFRVDVSVVEQSCQVLVAFILCAFTISRSLCRAIAIVTVAYARDEVKLIVIDDTQNLRTFVVIFNKNR